MRRTEVLCATLRGPPRARLRRRPGADRPALLHQLRRADVRARRASERRGGGRAALPRAASRDPRDGATRHRRSRRWPSWREEPAARAARRAQHDRERRRADRRRRALGAARRAPPTARSSTRCARGRRGHGGRAAPFAIERYGPIIKRPAGARAPPRARASREQPLAVIASRSPRARPDAAAARRPGLARRDPHAVDRRAAARAPRRSTTCARRRSRDGPRASSRARYGVRSGRSARAARRSTARSPPRG